MPSKAALPQGLIGSTVHGSLGTEPHPLLCSLGFNCRQADDWSLFSWGTATVGLNWVWKWHLSQLGSYGLLRSQLA